jgi:hypothetical protein
LALRSLRKLRENCLITKLSFLQATAIEVQQMTLPVENYFDQYIPSCRSKAFIVHGQIMVTE